MKKKNKYFTMVYDNIEEDSRLSDRAYRLYIHLLKQSRIHKSNRLPRSIHNKYLEDVLKCSEQSLNNALNLLEKLRYIDRETQRIWENGQFRRSRAIILNEI